MEDKNLEFIKKARLVDNHKEEDGEYKYDYPNLVYKSNRKLIKINCKNHGEFEQLPYNHLMGSGCPKCAREKNGLRCRSTKEKFVKKAMKIKRHKDENGKHRYDYSKFIYYTSKILGIIICLLHGEFEQTPDNHLAGYGCRDCGYNSSSKALADTKEEFVAKSMKLKVHKDKCGNHNYDYSKFIYKNSKTPGTIICKIHGEFQQSPDKHLAGHGCIICNHGSYSQECIRWLEYESKNRNIDIQHAENNGEYSIKYDENKIIKADGYCKDENIIFEYHGCAWHGCLKCFKEDGFNHPYKKKKKITNKEIYNKTIERENKIKELGYKLVTIWSHEWLSMCKNKANIIPTEIIFSDDEDDYKVNKLKRIPTEIIFSDNEED